MLFCAFDVINNPREFWKLLRKLLENIVKKIGWSNRSRNRVNVAESKIKLMWRHREFLEPTFDLSHSTNLPRKFSRNFSSQHVTSPVSKTISHLNDLKKTAKENSTNNREMGEISKISINRKHQESTWKI